MPQEVFNIFSSFFVFPTVLFLVISISLNISIYLMLLAIALCLVLFCSSLRVLCNEHDTFFLHPQCYV